MNYLFAPESFPDRDKFCAEICDAIGRENRLAMFVDIQGLSTRLRTFNNPEIVTLLAIKRVDLPSIIAIKELFLNAAVIILLSEGDQDTFDLAIQLKPKFIGMMNEDLEKVVPIVRKLALKNQRNRS